MKEQNLCRGMTPEARTAIFGIIESIVAEDPLERDIEILKKRELLLDSKIKQLADRGKKIFQTDKVFYNDKEMSVGEFEDAVDSILENDNFYIVTGFFVPKSQTIGTDGLSGTCFLARALDTLGKKVYILSDPHNEEILKKGLESIHLFPSFISPDFSKEPKDWFDFSIRSCLISIERPGIGVDGKYRAMDGKEIPVYPLDKIFIEAQNRKNKIKTISCADELNEVGMGKLPRGIIPAKERVQSIIPVDDLILGGTADWAVYGLIAALQSPTGKHLLPSLIEQEELLKVIINNGAVDGITGKDNLSVDSLPIEEHKGKVKQLIFFAYP